jgi:hypothetical protein
MPHLGFRLRRQQSRHGENHRRSFRRSKNSDKPRRAKHSCSSYGARREAFAFDAIPLVGETAVASAAIKTNSISVTEYPTKMRVNFA